MVSYISQIREKLFLCLLLCKIENIYFISIVQSIQYFIYVKTPKVPGVVSVLEMLNVPYVSVFLVVWGKFLQCSGLDWQRLAKNLAAMHGNSVKGAVVITDRFCTFSPSSISQLKVLEKQSLMSNSMPSASPCTPSTLKLFTKTSASTASSVFSNSIIPLPVLGLNTYLRKGRNSNGVISISDRDLK